MVHLKEVGLLSLRSLLVVFGDLGLVLHEDLQTKLILLRVRVVPSYSKTRKRHQIREQNTRQHFIVTEKRPPVR